MTDRPPFFLYFYYITNILQGFEGRCVLARTDLSFADAGLRLFQVGRAADPQVTAPRLSRHAGPRDRLVRRSQEQPRRPDHAPGDRRFASSRSESQIKGGDNDLVRPPPIPHRTHGGVIYQT